MTENQSVQPPKSKFTRRDFLKVSTAAAAAGAAIAATKDKGFALEDLGGAESMVDKTNELLSNIRANIGDCEKGSGLYANDRAKSGDGTEIEMVSFNIVTNEAKNVKVDVSDFKKDLGVNKDGVTSIGSDFFVKEVKVSHETSDLQGDNNPEKTKAAVIIGYTETLIRTDPKTDNDETVIRQKSAVGVMQVLPNGETRLHMMRKGEISGHFVRKGENLRQDTTKQNISGIHWADADQIIYKVEVEHEISGDSAIDRHVEYWSTKYNGIKDGTYSRASVNPITHRVGVKSDEDELRTGPGTKIFTGFGAGSDKDLEEKGSDDGIKDGNIVALETEEGVELYWSRGLQDMKQGKQPDDTMRKPLHREKGVTNVKVDNGRIIGFHPLRGVMELVGYKRKDEKDIHERINDEVRVIAMYQDTQDYFVHRDTCLLRVPEDTSGMPINLIKGYRNLRSMPIIERMLENSRKNLRGESSNKQPYNHLLYPTAEINTPNKRPIPIFISDDDQVLDIVEIDKIKHMVVKNQFDRVELRSL